MAVLFGGDLVDLLDVLLREAAAGPEQPEAERDRVEDASNPGRQKR
jgi:hypothetical protein